jgi:hypothetical protein
MKAPVSGVFRSLHSFNYRGCRRRLRLQCRPGAADGSDWLVFTELTHHDASADLPSHSCASPDFIRARSRHPAGSFTEGFRCVWGRPSLRVMVMLFLTGRSG